jgi:hypothetical protein
MTASRGRWGVSWRGCGRRACAATVPIGGQGTGNGPGERWPPALVAGMSLTSSPLRAPPLPLRCAAIAQRIEESVVVQQRRQIRCRGCGKSKAMASSCWLTGNLMIRVRSQGAGVRCSFSTAEARRMWSAVCSRRSTADRPPGAKILPRGGDASSAAYMPVRSTSGPQGRYVHRGRPNAERCGVASDAALSDVSS